MVIGFYLGVRGVMGKQRKKSTLVVLMLVMVVNALAYGTIIPLLYPYASKFGINPTGLSWLFVSFSVAQFIATPIMGRLSDRYGRKPLLVISLLGTSLSLAAFAAARNVEWLFAARILDGITGGNVSVAQAVIADSTQGKERGKSLGMLGAAFGFGFLVGPALGGVLSQIGLTTPFWFASGLAMVGVILAILVLEETVGKGGARKLEHEPLFKWRSLFGALLTPDVGVVLLITLLVSMAQNAWIIGFQAFTVDVLKLSAKTIGLMFAGVGLVSVMMQGYGVRLLMDKIESKRKILTASLVIVCLLQFVFGFAESALVFTLVMLVYVAVFAPAVPVITAIVSERTKSEDQGGILGINQSYTSVGQIFGPLAAGMIIGGGPRRVFLLSAAVMVLALLASLRLYVPSRHKADL